MMEVVAYPPLYNYSFMVHNLALGFFPTIAIALNEFTKEVNYAVVSEKTESLIFLAFKYLVTQ